MHCVAASEGVLEPLVKAMGTAEDTAAPCGQADHSGSCGHGQHDCPATTLAKAGLAAPLSIPALPCEDADNLLVLLQRINDALLQAEQEKAANPPTEPDELLSSWVFTSRAALPARSPSELV